MKRSKILENPNTESKIEWLLNCAKSDTWNSNLLVFKDPLYITQHIFIIILCIIWVWKSVTDTFRIPLGSSALHTEWYSTGGAGTWCQPLTSSYCRWDGVYLHVATHLDGLLIKRQTYSVRILIPTTVMSGYNLVDKVDWSNCIYDLASPSSWHHILVPHR